MSDDHLSLAHEVQPTEESRASLAKFGITDRAVQDDCYRALADGLAKACLAQAWEAGHRTPWRRGPDECSCSAWSRAECACGKYGTGELLSLTDSPYAEGDPR